MRQERTAIRRFPSHWRRITDLCEQDETFRSLCADYDEVSKAAKRWSKPGGTPGRAEEYRNVALQLEAEILARVHDAEAAVPSDSGQVSTSEQS